MNPKLMAAFALVAGLSALGGFWGARSLHADEKASHYAADSADLDRTRSYLRGDLDAAVESIRMIAADVTPENAEAKKAEREKALAEAMKPLQEDAYVLLVQGHLLCLDHIADTGGEPAQQFVQQSLYNRLGLAADEVARRREQTGLGHGGLLIGYLIAAASKTPADDIFKLKKEHAWPEIMRVKNVSVGELTKKLEGKD